MTFSSATYEPCEFDSIEHDAPAPLRRSNRVGRSSATSYSDDIVLSPGSASTTGRLEPSPTRGLPAATALVKFLVHRGLAQLDHSGNISHVKISKQAGEASHHLLDLLSPNAGVPTMAPDGEGGLQLLWKAGDTEVIVVVDGWNLHAVASPGTKQAVHLHDLAFRPGRLPAELQSLFNAV